MLNLYLVQTSDKYGPNSFLALAISYQWMYAQADNRARTNAKDINIQEFDVRVLCD
jgi:hypothetical protein